MTGVLYLAMLLGALGCMALLDRRFSLVFPRSPWRAAAVLATGTAFLLAWDVLAIGNGFYHRGESTAMTGVLLAPELPLEELVFVVFLCYLTLVLHGLLQLAVKRAAR